MWLKSGIPLGQIYIPQKHCPFAWGLYFPESALQTTLTGRVGFWGDSLTHSPSSTRKYHLHKEKRHFIECKCVLAANFIWLDRHSLASCVTFWTQRTTTGEGLLATVAWCRSNLRVKQQHTFLFFFKHWRLLNHPLTRFSITASNTKSQWGHTQDHTPVFIRFADE